MRAFVIATLILIVPVGLGAISAMIVDADKARRKRAERERRDQQWRHL